MASLAGSLPPQSDTPAQPPDRQQASPSTLAGDIGTDAPKDPQSDEGLKQVVQAVRQMQMQAKDLARQFPAAVSSLRAVDKELTNVIRQIVTNPGSPEPPSPSIGG